MRTVTLGSTGITVNKNGFGALPIQRISKEDAAALLRLAYDNGIRYFDTARMYTDSEEKIGYALADVRKNLYLATKTMGVTGEAVKKDLETSLEALRTDYIDVYQLHNPSFCPKPEDGTGVYEALLEAKTEGKIRHIAITNHRLHVAEEAVNSGLYEVLQYPFSYMSGDKEKALVKLCAEKNVGFVCMKGMSGGLITSGRAAYAFMSQYDNALPIWGVQKREELEEFLSCNTDDFEQEMTPEIEALIEADRREFAGDFCRGCGYCLPCPADIRIFDCARMSLFLKRAPIASYTTDMWKEEMHKIENCIECGACKSRCPYGLDIPRLLKENYASFKPYF